MEWEQKDSYLCPPYATKTKDLKAREKRLIFFQKVCQIKKNCYFCTRFDKHPTILMVGLYKKLKQVQFKRIIHVHRHIGLTARLDSNV